MVKNGIMEIESKQITVWFDDDHPGSLAGVTGILSRHAVNILAMTASGNRENGRAHFVVDRIALACNILQNHGYHVICEDVLCLQVKNVAGALHRSLQLLAEHDINIDYIYAFAQAASEGGTAVIKCDEAARAKSVLMAHFKELWHGDE